MLVIVWENNYDRWRKLHEWTQDRTNKNKKQPNKNGKYTSVDDGQKDFGGWSEEGLETYNDYKRQIKKSYKDPKRLQYEKKFLAHLRTKYKIECATDDLQRKLNRKRKKAAAGSKPVEVPKAKKKTRIMPTWDDSDDEDARQAGTATV